ncbi:IPT/TIG domain-containing protein [Streptomyces sp. NPDC059787]|uniref:IPT/TIG domain-containing protein n=1 Tax=Streptomyces sp. NPDC059787 TaxID=3346947 RepID=UPI00365F52E0
MIRSAERRIQMLRPGEPFPIPPGAYEALDSMRDAYAPVLPTEVAFGVGLKRIGGTYVEELALIVYVPDKRPPTELPLEAMIPRTWEGYATDVVESHPEPLALLNDTAFFHAPRGGVSIGWEDPFQVHIGTLGAVAQRRSDGARRLLTANHVTPAPGIEMFQPHPGAPQSTLLGIVELQGTDWDCAILEPNPGRGSPDCSVLDIGALPGSSTAPPGDHVWNAARKRGRATGLTSGVIVAHMHPGEVGIERLRVDTFPFGGLFLWHGDSGAVLVNANDDVIGLLVQGDEMKPSSTSSNPTSAVGLALPIAPVLDELSIEIGVDPPVVSDISPNTALGVLANGGKAMITGRGFDSTTTVTFNGVGALGVIPASPHLLVVIPPVLGILGTVPVVVTNAFGEQSTPGPQAMFTY